MPTVDELTEVRPEMDAPATATSVELRSLGKAMLILNTLGDLGGRATLSEIVRGCGLAKSTVHRVLAVLLSHDAVFRVGDHYKVGGMLRHVATQEPMCQFADLRRTMKPFLLDVYQKVRQPAALVVPTERGVVCIDIVFGHNQQDEAPPLVRPLPLYCTAAGKIFLAFDPAAAECLPGLFSPYTVYTLTSRQELAEELYKVRRDGIARCIMEYTEGIVSLAGPVRDGHGRVAAAIEVYGRIDGFSWAAVEGAVRRAAFGASSVLSRSGETSKTRLPEPIRPTVHPKKAQSCVRPSTFAGTR
jgi:DNA-binding IclR family transcriptional regulator